MFEVARATSAEEVNQLLKQAAAGALKDILGYETRPLVSIDYRTDHVQIIDALSTVVNDTHVKKFMLGTMPTNKQQSLGRIGQKSGCWTKHERLLAQKSARK